MSKLCRILVYYKPIKQSKMKAAKLYVTELGDNSVGIQDQTWEIEAPFAYDDDLGCEAPDELLEEFRNGIIELYQNYCGGKIKAGWNFDYKDEEGGLYE